MSHIAPISSPPVPQDPTPESQSPVAEPQPPVAEPQTAVDFSATVGGKNFGADVVYADGQYLASDPNVAGAQATGQSVNEAENALTSRLDCLI
jgi:hypothetical protein